MKNKQPIVYVARDIWFCNGLGDHQKIACFVSPAHLYESFKEYFEDGSVNQEFLVKFDNKPERVYLSKNAYFDVDARKKLSFKVDKIFKNYQSCKDYVNNTNNLLSNNHIRVLSSMIAQKNSIHNIAVKYGQKLEHKLIPSTKIIAKQQDDEEYVFALNEEIL